MQSVAANSSSTPSRWACFWSAVGLWLAVASGACLAQNSADLTLPQETLIHDPLRNPGRTLERSSNTNHSPSQDQSALHALTQGNISNRIAQQELPRQEDDKATINLAEPGAIDMRALVQFAAQQEKFQLILDNEQFNNATNKVIFFSRVEVNRSTMMMLVQEVLRANGFALVDAQVDGWKRVTTLPDVVHFAKVTPVDQIHQAEFEYVTAIFEMQHITPEDAKTYLTAAVPGKMVDFYKPLGRSRLLLVTDIVPNIQRIKQMLPQIDIPVDDIQAHFYKVKHLEAKELELQLNSIVETRQQIRQDTTAGQASSSVGTPIPGFLAATVKISSDARTNRLVMIGRLDAVTELMKLIEQIDIPLGSNTEFRTYRFQHVAASRIDELIRGSLAGGNESVDRSYRSTVDLQQNQLVVSCREEIHQRIERLKEQLDVPRQDTTEQSLMRFYTLKHVKVADIVQTLQSIERTYRPRQQAARTPQSGIRGREGFRPSGPNYFNDSFREGPPVLPPGYFDQGLGNQGGLIGSNQPDFAGQGAWGQPGVQSQTGSFQSPALNSLAAMVSDLESPTKLIPGDAQLTIDEKTNTLIVVAEPEVQALYMQLIQRLDVRRPQVLIEAHVVVIEGRDELNLGVEISGGDRQGEKKLFAFSSFGLSDVDGADGLLRLNPGLGFNGTLVDPDTADIVIRALASHSRSRVISSPKVVVEDNANGLLSSVSEQPFASVNATNTVATTSFAGFAQAGTTINVTPRISENDYLNLEFDILVNTFTGEPAPNLPPPRNTDQVVSQVTLPDGYTIVVGGLNRQRIAQTNTGIPFIEKIPVLKHLGSSKSNQYSDGMMFIFLKPTILRDDRFRDLIYLSSEEQEKAFLDSDFPQSCPQLIR